MRVTSVESTELFVGTREHPRQVVAAEIGHTPGREVRLTAVGPGVRGTGGTRAVVGDDGTVRAEIPVTTDLAAGGRTHVTVTAEDADDPEQRAERTAAFVAAEPGWTMFTVSHFHYDPVWWNTQAAYTETWDVADDPAATGLPARAFGYRSQSGMSLVRSHCDLARRDPAYTFVLAEVDYLKPYWDAFPEERAFLRELLRTGRVEIMGGTYNEPNTNLTGAEATIRNAVYGDGFQRGVMGASPETAWQLDAFGHDPQFPGLMADAGLSSSSWARGPYHQWGPTLSMFGDEPRDPDRMQFPAEFSWIAPSGRGLLTAYMVNHYGAGWVIDNAPTLPEAEAAALKLFKGLKQVALTRNVLLPVGGDYAPPCRWVMDIHRDWSARYVWPRFISGVPRDFFAAVRAELDAEGRTASPQTRDMNPVYTGKDVSYIDTKQAQRYGETLLADAEAWATLASLVTGHPYPDAALDKAWRQLIYGAHHDAVTGSESDQVYIDLLTGWRELADLARAVHADATDALARNVAPLPGGGPDLVVFNSATWPRQDVLTVADPGLVPLDDTGLPLPAVRENGELRVVVPEVPGMGLKALPLAKGDVSGWTPGEGTTIRNEFYELTVDPSRGGGVSRLRALAEGGRDLLRAGDIGNELVVQEEYPRHPRFGEGPWHLTPTGTTAARGREVTADVRTEQSPAGQRITVTADLGPFRYTQRLCLWKGVARLDVSTTIDGFDGEDRLIRVRWPSDVRGGLPVHEVADAVIGRGFGFVDVDSERFPWTLDNPANTWFGLGSTARAEIRDDTGTLLGHRSIGVAELVYGSWEEAGELGTPLAAALVRAGVTATSTIADGPRYGDLEVDSNLPDIRIAVGGPDRNTVVAEALGWDPAAGRELRRQLTDKGVAAVWVAPRASLREEWVPGADLKDLERLPLLVVAGARPEDDAKAVDALVADLDDAVLRATAAGGGEALPPGDAWDGRSFAVLNRGTPGCVVTSSGDLYMSLMRSCTGWPSGVWIDPPRRTAPDGSGFQLQRWSHTFDHAVVGGTGDWRALGLPRSGHAYNHPLTARLRRDGSAAGPVLPRRATLLALEPEGEVLLDAVKPAGSPLARASVAPADPGRGVVVRMHEVSGRPVRARVRGPLAWTDGARADVLETPGAPLVPDEGGGLDVALTGFEVATVLATPQGARPPGGPGIAAHEPAQPVHTRYWLHNSGPAPRGNLPVAVYVSPTALTASGPVTATVRVSSELTDAPVSGTVALRVPPGWSAEPAELPYALGPGGFTLTEVTVTPPPDAAPGRHWLAARLSYGGQTYEDVVALDVPGTVPEGEPDGRTGPTLVSVLGVERVRVRSGERARIPVFLRNATRGPVGGTLWAVSSWGTWPGVGPGCQGFTVPAGERLECAIEVDGGAVPPGSYWLLAKIAWHGQVAYTEAVALEVTD